MPKSNINSADDSGERDGGRERERHAIYVFSSFAFSAAILSVSISFCQFLISFESQRLTPPGGCHCGGRGYPTPQALGGAHRPGAKECRDAAGAGESPERRGEERRGQGWRLEDGDDICRIYL